MDTKWKNSRRKRIKITILALCLLSLVNVCVFPFMVDYIQSNREVTVEGAENSIRESVAERLYKGCYVLYYEHMVSSGQVEGTITDFYFPSMTKEEIARLGVEYEMETISDWLERWTNSFEIYRDKYDYYTEMNEVGYSYTQMPISAMLESPQSTVNMETAKQHYKYYFAMVFDENGNLQMDIEQSGDIEKNTLSKHFQKLHRTENLQEEIKGAGDVNDIHPRKITSFTVVYGIPYDVQADYSLSGFDYDAESFYYLSNHNLVMIGYGMNVVLLLILMVIMTSQKIWDNTIIFTRHGRQYLLEVAWFIGLPLAFGFCNLYGQEMASNGGTGAVISLFQNGGWETLIGSFLRMLCIFVSVYLTFLYIRPLFEIGLSEYIQEYSLCYRIWKAIKRGFVKIIDMLKTIDLEQKSTKTIFKFVVIEFVILAVLMCMWFMGLFGLLIYSIALFFFLNKYYSKIVADYQKVLAMTKRIAKGEFKQEENEDFGVFNSMKTELGKIENGFQKAVEEETKSQRMKTELITNVSHDLKTPLTAITTYVELLKKEDITEEERKEYIDTLSRKSMRLKVLIEDLFEVSKASSQNIVLNYMDVDVVNLLKQVYIEHEEKLSQMGLDIKWNLAQEKIVLSLDNQKTYRIFENLFVNIQKYAMPNSRVYIDILQEADHVQIVMKNISATELNIRPEELTERFVRGDQSRNTEGSGLGLAIAKSFTEAQKGRFEVFVDGDLFKVVIVL